MGTDHPEKIGRYRIVERVGRGAMGALFRGVDSVLDREVAVKLMLQDFSDGAEQARPRFYQEARAIAKLQHPNIVTVFEFAEEDNTPYIVMEFLRGSSLATLMSSSTPMTLDDKLSIIAQLASALSYAHEQGIVHRDVKPANVFVLNDGTVKLLDFGVAKMMSSTLTQQGDILGSASYMSPEQVSGSDAVDGRSDVFSAGVVLYELLAGRKPFDADSPTAILLKILNAEPPRIDDVIPGLPAHLGNTVRRALAKNPADRFATAGDFARDLQAIRRGAPLPSAAADDAFNGTRVVSSGEARALHKELALRQAPAATAAVQDEVEAAASSSGGRGLVFAGLAAVVLIGVMGFVYFGRGGTGGESEGVAVNQAGAVPAVAEAAGGAAGAPVAAAIVKTSLRVDSTPPGAAITINGRETTQVTPTAIELEGAGPHQVRLSMEGFIVHEAEVTDADLQRGDVAYTLAAVVPKIPVVISSTYPVRVFEGTEAVTGEAQSHKLEIAEGATLRVSAPKVLLNASIKVAGERVNYRAPALGYLTVRTSRETCNVRIGRQALGYPPITKMPVVPGQYRVEMDCPDGQKPAPQAVTVAADGEAVVRILLSPASRLSTASRAFRNAAQLRGKAALRGAAVLAIGTMAAVSVGAQNTGDFAQRQYESGVQFMQNQRYTEALKDFQVVIESFPKSPVADDALMQTALYYLDVTRDLEAARTAADRLLKEYPESDSAPMAYVITGRLAMARARTAADVDGALASFERVPRLFPASTAVAAARFYLGEALKRQRRQNEAVNQFRRAALEFPRSPYAARATLAAAASLPAPDRVAATMSDLQRIRQQFPKSGEAVAALNLNTILHRLYMRPPGQAFRFSGRSIATENAKLRDIVGMFIDRSERLVVGHRQGVTVLDEKAAVVSTALGEEPSAFFVDEAGRIVMIRNGAVVVDRALPAPIRMVAADNRTARNIEDVPAAVMLSSGERLIADRRQRLILRMNTAGDVQGTFTAVNALRLAVSRDDDVAIIDRDARTVQVVDRDGKLLYRVAAKGTGYDLPDPADVSFDPFGHLYVLDGDKPVIYVFRPGGALVASLAASDPVTLQRPRALAVDGAGRLYLYDDRLQRIQIFQ